MNNDNTSPRVQYYGNGWIGTEVEEGEDVDSNMIRVGSYVKYLDTISVVYSIELMEHCEIGQSYYKIAFYGGEYATTHYSVKKIDIESPIRFNEEFFPI